jgi:hypothetical protein
MIEWYYCIANKIVAISCMDNSDAVHEYFNGKSGYTHNDIAKLDQVSSYVFRRRLSNQLCVASPEMAKRISKLIEERR